MITFRKVDIPEHLMDAFENCEIGQEKTPAEFVAAIVEVARGVRHVLRDDGVFWLNLGDSYAGSWGNSGSRPELDGKTQSQREKSTKYLPRGGWDDNRERPASSYKLPGIKPKDLMGIPWRVALALQDDGWYLRCDVIWNKPDCMPDSVQDRPTRSHEYLFMLTKSARYFYDTEAVKEAGAESSITRLQQDISAQAGSNRANAGGKTNGTMKAVGEPGSRNLRSVWTIPTARFDGAHFATFPPALIEPCIKSSTSEEGACQVCGAPWQRIVEKNRVATRPGDGSKVNGMASEVIGNRDPQRHCTETKTTGWKATCGCSVDQPLAKCVVLDPFAGSGTTAEVARNFGCAFVGCELDVRNEKLQAKRLEQAMAF